MARIRTYKPEIFSDSATGRLSGDAFRLFLGLLAHADDYGFIGADVPEIIAEVLPFWGLSRMGDVAKLFEEISSAKRNKPQPLLAAVEHDGATFFVIPNFRRHQKVDHPARPLIPTVHHKKLSIHGFHVDQDGSVALGDPLRHAFYDDNSGTPREPSTNTREDSRAFTEDSENTREASASPRSRARADLRDRKDRKGSEGSKTPHPGADASASGSVNDSPAAPQEPRPETTKVHHSQPPAPRSNPMRSAGQKTPGPVDGLLGLWDRVYSETMATAYVRTAIGKERAAASRMLAALLARPDPIPDEVLAEAMRRFHASDYWRGKGFAAFVENAAQFLAQKAPAAVIDISGFIEGVAP